MTCASIVKSTTFHGPFRSISGYCPSHHNFINIIRTYNTVGQVQSEYKPLEISKVTTSSITILDFSSLSLTHSHAHKPLTNQEHMMPHLLPKATSVCAFPDKHIVLKHEDSFKIFLILLADNLHTDMHHCSSFENTPRQSHTPLSPLALSPVAKQQFSSGDMHRNTECIGL